MLHKKRNQKLRVNLDPLGLAANLKRLRVGTIVTDLGALPLERGRIVPQKGRPRADDWGCEIQRARESVTIGAPEIPLWIEAAGAREVFRIKEPRW